MTLPPSIFDDLIAEFGRSGVGELDLSAPDFRLQLRRGRKPRWIASKHNETAPQS